MRPHPSEPPYKHDVGIKENSHLDLQLDLNKILSESISNTRCVVGVETYAMEVDVFFRKENIFNIATLGAKIKNILCGNKILESIIK